MNTATHALALLGRISAAPMLLAPEYTTLGDVVRHMIHAPAGESASRDFMAAYRASHGDFGTAVSPFATVGDTAVVPVHGVLVNRFADTCGYVTGYQYVETAVAAAMDAPGIRRVVLDVDSYGGEAAGAFELADLLRGWRGGKPLLAAVNASAYSAGYAIASAADRIVVVPSGGVGSIGVATMHVDISRALTDAGIAVTQVYAGAHKTDGSPFRPLTADAKAAIQGRIDELYDVFVSTVARNRGLPVQTIRDTEARTYSADTALRLGLIDAVAPFRDVLDPPANPNRSATRMAHPSNATAPEPAVAATPEPAVATTPEPAVAVKERVRAILACPEADGRTDLSRYLALDTDIPVQAARHILAASPKAVKTSGAAFAAAMEGGNPEVGMDSGDAQDGPEDVVARINRNHARATGRRLDP